MKYRIWVPFLLVTLVLSGLAFPHEAQASETVYHVVQRGETLAKIAWKYGVSVAAIQRANNLWNPNLIYTGQYLVIPLSGSPSTPGCTTTHIVKRGEYIKTIAARYNVSWWSIVEANGLRNPNLIYPGQRLKIPCKGTPPSPPSPSPGNYVIHVVRRGEYLKTIAVKYGVTVSAIVQANGLSNPNFIYTGQRLKIPTTKPQPKPTPKPTPKPGDKPWSGKYWDNQYLSGNPTFTRKESLIDFAWGTAGPGDGISGTTFSARWQRTKYFDAGKYRFHVKVDDGIRVWVDGTQVIDQWHDSAPRYYSGDKELGAGNHTLQIDYYQNQGGAQVKFWIERLDTPTPWKGEFYNNKDLSGDPAVTKHFGAANFDWGNKAPVSGVTADYFSARFTRELDFAEGKYHFTATVDDGVRVWLDDTLIIDQWHLTSVTTYGADVDVSAGKHTVKVEYFENTGDAVCKIGWSKK